MSIQVTGIIEGPLGTPSPGITIRVVSKISYKNTYRLSTEDHVTTTGGAYDFQLNEGFHKILIRYRGASSFTKLGDVSVSDQTPSPITLINLLESSSPKALVVKLQDLADDASESAQSASDDADQVALDKQAVTQLAQQVSDDADQVALDKAAAAQSEANAAQSEANINVAVTGAQEEILPPGSEIYPEIGVLKNGDVVTVGVTHLRALVGGEPTIVEMSPFANGSVSLLTENGATIGGVDVQFSRQNETSYPFSYGSDIDVVLIYGQSNARGYAGNTEGDLDYASPLIKVWDGSTIIPLTSYTPTQNDGTSTGSAWKSFGNEYAKLTGRKAIIANCARGSQSIQDLSKGEPNTNYSGLVQWKSDIESYIVSIGSSVGKVFVVFHQGERDSQLATTKVDYEALLLQLWADIKADTGADNMFICTVGTYSSGQQKLDAYPIQAAQRNIGSSNSEIKLVWDEMPCMGDYKVDGVHLNQLGYNYMGEQIARNVSSMLFETNVSSPKPAIEKKGNLLLDGSQNWKVFGGWITNSSGNWVVTNDSSRASCNVISVADNSDHLLVTLSE